MGLALSVGLARHGIRSVLLERNDGTSRTSRAPAIHVRTREIFRQWGIERAFLDAGELLRSITLHSTAGGRPLLSVDFSELDDEAQDPGLLILEQNRTEQLLLDAARASGLCEVRFGTEVVGLAQDDALVTLSIRENGEEHSLSARYVVGCDGASSFVRSAVHMPFEGKTYSLRPMLADIELHDERNSLPYPRAWNGASAFAFAVRLPGGSWRLVSLDRGTPRADEDVPDEEVRSLARELLGKGPVEVAWSSRFRIHLRSSPRFRIGRVLLAGDAAHVHSPASGFGMNGGIHDAHNLAWKLAGALHGGDADRLLDSYDIERRAVIVESVSRYTDTITRFFLDSPRSLRLAALALIRAAQRIGFQRRRGLRRTAMIDLDYPGSPLLDRRQRAAGIRLPDLRLVSAERRGVRLYELLPIGPVMLVVSDDREGSERLPVEHVIRVGEGQYHDRSGTLRSLLGGRDGWILVRPDAHVAWARQHDAGLDSAVRRALGRPS